MEFPLDRSRSDDPIDAPRHRQTCGIGGICCAGANFCDSGVHSLPRARRCGNEQVQLALDGTGLQVSNSPQRDARRRGAGQTERSVNGTGAVHVTRPFEPRMHHYLPALPHGKIGDHARRCLHFLLRMFGVRSVAEKETGHLLRVLLLRVSAVSARSGSARLRKNRPVQPVFVMLGYRRLR